MFTPLHPVSCGPSLKVCTQSACGSVQHTQMQMYKHLHMQVYEKPFHFRHKLDFHPRVYLKSIYLCKKLHSIAMLSSLSNIQLDRPHCYIKISNLKL